MAEAVHWESGDAPFVAAAIRAWSSLGGRARGPVDVLKRHRGPRPGYVIRLGEARTDGASVIAKLCDSEKAEMEAIAQRGILPALGLAALEIFGRVPDGDGREWLFLEYAGDTYLRPEQIGDAGLAARWLAVLHAGGADHPALARFPERGLGHHLGELVESVAAIEAARANPVLSPQDRDLLERVLARLRGLAARWGEVESSCAPLPHGLVHGDFVPKNVRVGRRRGRAVLFVFDWETAGRGLPASDLASAGLARSRSALGTWLRRARGRWPELGPDGALRLARVGQLLRLVSSVRWSSECLYTPWLAKPLAQLAGYERELGAILDAPRKG